MNKSVRPRWISIPGTDGGIVATNLTRVFIIFPSWMASPESARLNMDGSTMRSSPSYFSLIWDTYSLNVGRSRILEMFVERISVGLLRSFFKASRRIVTVLHGLPLSSSPFAMNSVLKSRNPSRLATSALRQSGSSGELVVRRSSIVRKQRFSEPIVLSLNMLQSSSGICVRHPKLPNVSTALRR